MFKNLSLKEENYIIDALQFFRSLENRQIVGNRFGYNQQDFENLRQLEDKINE